MEGEGVAWINVTCRCGHTADFAEFCRTTIGGELPPGQFQCPACSIAWRRKESGHRILRAGSEVAIIPGKVELVPVQGRL